jgi:alpha-D-ribose 1-methylphosphonate 5-triphosphate synthase subunit PhnG
MVIMPLAAPASASPEIAARQRWMAILARASHAETLNHLADLPPLPAHTVLRGPEAGMVMVRGRAGGGGGPFNLGEMTVTRCTVRDADGRIGHATIAGREPRQCELAAQLDAILQDAAWHDRVESAVIAPLEAKQAATREETARKAAATRVQFFTLTSMRSSA